MNDYQNPQWPPYPPQEGQSTTAPGADPGAGWDQTPDGAPPAPFVISPAEQPAPPSPYGGEPTSPSWYGQPSYPPPPAYPPAPEPVYPPAPAPSQPLGGYAPPPSQPLMGYPGAQAYMPPGYAAPSQPLYGAASQPLTGYPPVPGYGQSGYAPPPPAPPPGAGYGYGYGYPPQSVVMAPPQRANGTAVAVEAILAFFGIYGVGWLMAGETTVGALLLVGSFVWWGAAIFLTAITFGVGLFCIAPVNIAFLVLSAVLLANHTRS